MAVSRYAATGGADYSHRLHAGNVGDVWKHCVLVAVLRAVAAEGRPVTYVDTHAGEGRYPLHPTGEWTEGIGRLWGDASGDGGALADYLGLCRRLATGDERPVTYPGSPAFARAVLGDRAALALWERDARAAERLTAVVGPGAPTRVTTGDGLAALDGTLCSLGGDPVVVLVDPSWGRKADWQDVPDALVRALRAAPRACVMLWYPLKSLTRPNAMMERLAAAGVEGVAAELVTTPLAHQRRRLNGSGVLLVGAPAAALDAVAAAAPAIGRRCATLPGAWSFRLRAFAGPDGMC
jgi:23S rRNA (adenine2030-N6)-methyltransferase